MYAFEFSYAHFVGGVGIVNLNYFETLFYNDVGLDLAQQERNPWLGRRLNPCTNHAILLFFGVFLFFFVCGC